MLAEAVHKNNSVSGRAAGWLKKVRLETLFFHFCKIVFFSKIGQYFPTKKKLKWEKKQKCGRPTGFYFSHWLDRKPTFFMDGLIVNINLSNPI